MRKLEGEKKKAEIREEKRKVREAEGTGEYAVSGFELFLFLLLLSLFGGVINIR